MIYFSPATKMNFYIWTRMVDCACLASHETLRVSIVSEFYAETSKTAIARPWRFYGRHGCNGGTKTRLTALAKSLAFRDL